MPIPDSLCCPVLRKPFQEPVTVKCGHSFEREVVIKLLAEFLSLCPLCQSPLDRSSTNVNVALKELVAEFSRVQEKTDDLLKDNEDLNEVIDDLEEQISDLKRTEGSLNEQLHACKSIHGKIRKEPEEAQSYKDDVIALQEQIFRLKRKNEVIDDLVEQIHASHNANIMLRKSVRSIVSHVRNKLLSAFNKFNDKDKSELKWELGMLDMYGYSQYNVPDLREELMKYHNSLLDDDINNMIAGKQPTVAQPRRSPRLLSN